ncbi:hypothetical protein OK414_14650 [Priestia sp. JV24]|uniref:hypothetical protein n=1 Tax=Priestia TaxID=2800373 RepID=UPI0021D65FCE|nr:MULTISPECIES: hypothetical protein [Priestia]MCU7712456.1 hypothetical protein [Priestia megaterium]MCW1046285.1 hypothetical protein [Priestia sp. JV24]
MPVCYYCGSAKVVSQRHGKPACEDCLEEEVYSSKRSNQMLTEDEKAVRLKYILQTFKEAFSEKE